MTQSSLSDRARELLSSSSPVVAALAIVVLADAVSAQSLVFDICGTRMTDASGSGGNLVFVWNCPDTAVSGGVAGGAGGSGGSGPGGSTWSLWAAPEKNSLSLWSEIPPESGGNAYTYEYELVGELGWDIRPHDRLRVDYQIFLDIQDGSASLSNFHFQAASFHFDLPPVQLSNGMNAASFISGPIGVPSDLSSVSWQLRMDIELTDLAWGQIQSGSIAPGGFVLSLVATCNSADIAEPFGVTNFFDLSAFLSQYNSGNPAADLAPPFGVFNFFDVSTYLNLYNQGCQ